MCIGNGIINGRHNLIRRLQVSIAAADSFTMLMSPLISLKY